MWRYNTWNTHPAPGVLRCNIDAPLSPPGIVSLIIELLIWLANWPFRSRNNLWIQFVMQLNQYLCPVISTNLQTIQMGFVDCFVCLLCWNPSCCALALVKGYLKSLCSVQASCLIQQLILVISFKNVSPCKDRLLLFLQSSTSMSIIS